MVKGTTSSPTVKSLDAGTGSTGTADLGVSRLLPKDRRETNRGLHPVVLRDAVIMYEANRRQGTVQTRERHFVSGSTKKMHKQKHTGNARQGDGKAPHFRGGGTAFGPHPKDWGYAMPRKALRKALAVALSRKMADGEVTVVSGLAFAKPIDQGVPQAARDRRRGSRAPARDRRQGRREPAAVVAQPARLAGHPRRRAERP